MLKEISQLSFSYKFRNVLFGKGETNTHDDLSRVIRWSRNTPSAIDPSVIAFTAYIRQLPWTTIKRMETAELASFALIRRNGKEEFSGYLYIINASIATRYIYADARMRKKPVPSAGAVGNPKFDEMALKKIRTCDGMSRKIAPTTAKTAERVRLAAL
jgi:hypothetical protein